MILSLAPFSVMARSQIGYKVTYVWQALPNIRAQLFLLRGPNPATSDHAGGIVGGISKYRTRHHKARTQCLPSFSGRGFDSRHPTNKRFFDIRRIPKKPLITCD